MPRPPPISLAPRFPVTTLVCAAALVVSLSQMMGRSIDPFVINDRVYWEQPWRLLTCAFPHGSPAHLIFNLYWCWTLGAIAEHVLGRWRMAVLVLVSAMGSAAAEYAFAIGGIGLSGIVYGLFGAVWMVQKHVPQLRGMIDRPTVSIFIVWFFLCIVTTKLGWMHVANFAHGAGLVIGVLLGIGFVTSGWKRAMGWIGGVGLAVLFVACGWLWREKVNLRWSEVLVKQAYPLLEAGREADALPLLRKAWEREPGDEEIAHDYALVSYQAGHTDAAIGVFERWVREGRESKGLSGLAAAMAGEMLTSDRWYAVQLAEAATKLGPKNVGAWDILGLARLRVWDEWGAIDACEKALELDPTREDVRERLRWIRTGELDPTQEATEGAAKEAPADRPEP